MAELKKAQTAPALKQGVPTEPSLKQGGPETQLSAAPAATPSPAELKVEKTLSHPVWLLAAAGLLAGLYYFLKERKKNGR